MPRAPLPKPGVQQALQQAVTLHQQGRFDDAERLYQGILTGTPGNFDALHLLGVLMHQRGRSAEALNLIAQALETGTKSADALLNHGNVLFAMRRFAEALSDYERALALRPDDAELLSNRANTLCELNRPGDALASFDRALARRPNDPDILNNRGNALLQLNRAAEALASYDRALAIRPHDAQTLINRGNALTDLRRPDQALASYDRAIAIAPDHAEAHWNKSLILLAQGDFARGFAEYEWRRRRDGATDKRDFSQPLWLGEEGIAGRTILLHAEQGYGDTIQFVRYAPLLAARGAKVVLEVQASLRPLLSGLPGVSAITGRGEPLPPFDLHCPLMSLPLAFKTELATVPTGVPYLHAPHDRLAQWRSRLPAGKPLRVGLAWSGSPTHKNDHNRSIALSRLAPLCANDRVQFVSLQRDVREADAATLRKLSHVFAPGEALRDFADTAAVIALLDLVISVDTGVAHLAGALGKPVWILLPFMGEWRWLSDRDDSPWYPSARLFRQPKVDDWESVVARVQSELTRHAVSPSS
jgi:tetratricopeptide (TPR) repeat protein